MMRFWEKDDKYHLSIIVIFHNMRREARRTLHSLTNMYQQNIQGIRYDVIAIDNGSSDLLEKKWVEGFGENFQFKYYNAQTSSPCQALNYGVSLARGKFVMLCIDGARMLSPGIVHHSMLASRIFKNPFIYTLGMHIGNKPQNYLVEENYSQEDEDKLMASLDWRKDGYSLFDISSVALSSKKGYLSRITESNCMTMLRSTYEKIGGFDEQFRSAGGGLANLDFFNRVNQIDEIDPIMLLGEATFHQFHGGIATNVALKDHPIEKMMKEYLNVRGRPFEPYYKPPVYFGRIHPKCQRFFVPSSE